MRAFKYIFLLLYIYTTFNSFVICQNLHLDISSNDSIEHQFLNRLDFKKTVLNFNEIIQETDSLKKVLIKSGFPETQLLEITPTGDHSYMALFKLNTLYKDIQIKLPNNWDQLGYNKADQLVLPLKVDNHTLTIPYQQVEFILNQLTLLLAEKGDPFITLQLRNIQPAEFYANTLQADLIIESFPIRKITGFEIKGYEKFPVSFLKHALGIKKGDVFKKQNILDKSKLIDNLNFVKTIKPPEVLFLTHETKLFFYLEKKSSNFFDGIMGFATNEDTGKLEFNGYLNLALVNNLHYGELLEINYKNDGNQQEHFSVLTELPYLFKSPVGMEASLAIFKRDSTFQNVNRKIALTYRLNTKIKLFAGYKNDQSTNIQKSDLTANQIVDFKSSFIVLGGDYIQPQPSSLFPEKSVVRISAEIGERKTQKTTPQYRLQSECSHQFNLNPSNAIFLRNQSGYLITESALINELFRFGGINSIRGFDENSIDASFFTVLNTEYRFLLNEKSYLHSIIDLSYFENISTDIKQNLYSIGMGLAIDTKPGLFKFVIANGKAENQNFNFNNTKIHISLQARF